MSEELTHQVYGCTLCEAYFEQPQERAFHLIAKHGYTNGYLCHLCPKDFDSQEAVEFHSCNQHFRGLRPGGGRRCHRCGGMFRENTAYLKHVRYDHYQDEEGRRKCPVEGCTFTNTCDYAFTLHRSHVHPKLREEIWDSKQQKAEKRARDTVDLTQDEEENGSQAPPAAKRAKPSPMVSEQQEIIDITDDIPTEESLSEPPVAAPAPLMPAQQPGEAQGRRMSQEEYLAEQMAALDQKRKNGEALTGEEHKRRQHRVAMQKHRDEEKRRRDMIHSAEPSIEELAQRAAADEKKRLDRNAKQKEYRAKKKAANPKAGKKTSPKEKKQASPQPEAVPSPPMAVQEQGQEDEDLEITPQAAMDEHEVNAEDLEDGIQAAFNAEPSPAFSAEPSPTFNAEPSPALNAEPSPATPEEGQAQKEPTPCPESLIEEEKEEDLREPSPLVITYDDRTVIDGVEMENMNSWLQADVDAGAPLFTPQEGQTEETVPDLEALVGDNKDLRDLFLKVPPPLVEEDEQPLPNLLEDAEVAPITAEEAAPILEPLIVEGDEHSHDSSEDAVASPITPEEEAAPVLEPLFGEDDDDDEDMRDLFEEVEPPAANKQASEGPHLINGLALPSCSRKN